MFFKNFRRRRSRSRPRTTHNGSFEDCEPYDSRTMLMTNSEALQGLYGEITTERDGDLTHQCIQTNLADVICGGSFLCRNISLILILTHNGLFHIYLLI